MSPIDSLLEVGIDVPAKIQSIYNDCNDEEKQILIDILTELSQYGESETYKNLWSEDYKEIPVDLDTFLCNDRYLGKVTRNGEGIYPYWKTAMHQIFDLVISITNVYLLEQPELVNLPQVSLALLICYIG